MTPRSIRRAAERKRSKEEARKARNQETRLDDQLAPAVAPASISPAQLAANRANAQLSTGPRTEEGKCKVSLNAVKTALTGRTVLLPGDDAELYERHISAYTDEYSPVGPRECDLVQSIADTWWRLQRITFLESALLAKGYHEFSDAFDDHDPSVRQTLITAEAYLKYEKQIRNLQLQEARLFRRYQKDRAELRELQQGRRQQEQEAREPQPTRLSVPSLTLSDDDGFEFSTAEIAAADPLLRTHRAA